MGDLAAFEKFGPSWIIALAAVGALIWLIRWQANTLTSLIDRLMDVIEANTAAFREMLDSTEDHERRAAERHLQASQEHREILQGVGSLQGARRKDESGDR
jgi:hypothetical protein